MNVFNHQTWLAAALLLAASFNTSAQPLVLADEQAQRSPAAVVVRNGTLYFDGKITADSAQAMLRQLDMRRVASVSINSMGGDAQAAMLIGHELNLRKMDIEVRNICAAACASYLFPAGKSKFLSQGSLLLWPTEKPAELADDAAQTATFQQQETKFYQQIGVDPSIQGCPVAPHYFRPVHWFSWSVENLAKFGVKNITFATSANRWQKELVAKGAVFAEYCE